MALEEGLHWSGHPVDFRRYHTSIVQAAQLQSQNENKHMEFWWSGAHPIVPYYDCFENETCQLNLSYKKKGWRVSTQKEWQQSESTARQLYTAITQRQNVNHVFEFIGPLSCTIFINQVSLELQSNPHFSWTSFSWKVDRIRHPIYVAGVPSAIFSFKCLTIPSGITPLY
ncbi:hypothetical protein DSO57_1023356 [Entomophthora muscae]|uniref:Uncharacterized protein n=1 Tax=Entomophthora muscae TaxID=34485 RepID=A0ACC2S4W3_9FUNG|nr:hypothetical protein DSO57_1023356 [Entomophthora muscae]